MIEGGSIVNWLKSVVEKRYDLLRDFFDNVGFEMRITLGPRWEDSLLKSRPEHGKLLSELTMHKHFERDSEVHAFSVINLYSESLQTVLPIKFAVGVQLGKELTEEEQSRMLPRLNSVAGFNDVFV